MTEQMTPAVADGHILPDADWAKVVARVKEIQAELRDSAEGGASGPGGIVLDMTALGIRSRKYFPVSGVPTQLGVLHSAECPLQAGYAKSLSEWACGTIYPAGPAASWQRFVDPVHRVRLIPDELGAWHASEANPLSIGWEQAGYARYSRAEWLTADGRTQLEMLALDMAEVAVRDGLEPRWLADWEVRAVLDQGRRDIKGFCLHRQIDPETRTDPGGGYPYDLLMERIIFYMGGNATNTTEDPFMAYTENELARILAAADRINGVISDPNAKVLTTAHVRDMSAQAADAVLNSPIQRGGAGAGIGDGLTSLAAMAAWADDHTVQILSAVAAEEAAKGATVEEIQDALRRVMAEETVKVDVTVNGSIQAGEASNG